MTAPTIQDNTKELKSSLTVPANLRLLTSYDLIKYTVQLPMFTSKNDWITLKLLEMVKEVNVLCISIRHFCTEISCPRMNAGSFVDFNWIGDEGLAEKVSAPVYMRKLSIWAIGMLKDAKLCPIVSSCSYPESFQAEAKSVFRRLFRVYAHVYLEHFAEFTSAGASTALNTSFIHAFVFGKHFELLTEYDVAPIMFIVDALLS